MKLVMPPKKRAREISTNACGKYCDGWWCRGCGTSLKRDDLQSAGYTNEEAELITKFQRSNCGEKFAPCFICNRDGCIPIRSKVSAVPMLWYGFKLPFESNIKVPPLPKRFCRSCDEGWWCGGCGNDSKIEALRHHGYSDSSIDNIVEHQEGECSDPYAPCYICNRDGEIQCRELNRAVLPRFWDDFQHEDTET